MIALEVIFQRYGIIQIGSHKSNTNSYTEYNREGSIKQKCNRRGFVLIFGDRGMSE
jgi:hypothetical protein